jgi:hypothetical protein
MANLGSAKLRIGCGSLLGHVVGELALELGHVLLHLANILGVAGEIASGEANIVEGVALLETPGNTARVRVSFQCNCVLRALGGPPQARLLGASATPREPPCIDLSKEQVESIERGARHGCRASAMQRTPSQAVACVVNGWHSVRRPVDAPNLTG